MKVKSAPASPRPCLGGQAHRERKAQRSGIKPRSAEAQPAQANWANGGQSNIDEEALACGPHNRLVDEGGWRIRKLQDTAA